MAFSCGAVTSCDGGATGSPAGSTAIDSSGGTSTSTEPPSFSSIVVAQRFLPGADTSIVCGPGSIGILEPNEASRHGVPSTTTSADGSSGRTIVTKASRASMLLALAFASWTFALSLAFQARFAA